MLINESDPKDLFGNPLRSGAGGAPFQPLSKFELNAALLRSGVRERRQSEQVLRNRLFRKEEGGNHMSNQSFCIMSLNSKGIKKQKRSYIYSGGTRACTG